MIRSRNAYSDQVLDEVIRIYVTVDETGNLGLNLPGEREYVIAGCVVMDREKFMEVSYRESLNKGREIKFNTDPGLREKILRDSEPYVYGVYYVRYHKDKGRHNLLTGGITTEERHDIHLAMMRALANAIFTDYGGEIHIDIDANSLVREYEAIRSFEGSPKTDGYKVDARVSNSKLNMGLQTNDFYVGSIGHMVNGPTSNAQEVRESNRYVDIFRKKLKRVFLKDDDWEGLR